MKSTKLTYTVQCIASLFAATMLLSCVSHSPPVPTLSSNNERTIESVRLDNGLDVLLISDPKATHSAASIAVGVGYYQDPIEFAGLSHLLEHTVLLGSTNFPTQGQYKTLIDHNSGWSNATTTDLITYFRFQVESSAFEQALTRLSDLIASPILSDTFIESEVSAVDAEFKVSAKNDWRASVEVLKKTVNQSHPFSKFSTGDANTLRVGSSLTEALKNHHATYYVAQNMRLAIVSPQSLLALKHLVTQRFSKIASGKLMHSPPTQPLYTEGTLPNQVSVAVFSNSQSIDLRFLVPATHTRYKDKSPQFLAHLISHQGEGSIYRHLANEGLATSLSANTQDSLDHSVFNVYIKLTEHGLRNTDVVTRAVLSYVQMLKETNQSHIQRAFGEFEAINSLKHAYPTAKDPADEVAKISWDMFHYPKEDVLNHEKTSSGFSYSQFSNYLSNLCVDKLSILISDSRTSTASIEPRYNIGYKVAPLSERQIHHLKQNEVIASLHLPETNPYIAKLALNSVWRQNSSSTNEHQELGIKTWSTFNTSFAQPKAAITLRGYYSLEKNTPINGAVFDLLAEAFSKTTNSSRYNASLAGIDTEISTHFQGMTIKTNGFSEKSGAYVKFLLEQWATLEISEPEFKTLKSQLQKHYDERLSGRAFRVANGAVYEELTSHQYSDETLLQALIRLDYTVFSETLSKLQEKLQFELSIVGEYPETLGSDITTYIRHSFDKKLASTVKIEPKISNTTTALFARRLSLKTSDSVTVYHLLGKGKSEKLRANWWFTRYWLAPLYYDHMRTSHKLGYVAHINLMPVHHAPGISLVNQSSTASAETVRAHMRSFLTLQAEALSQMTDAEYQKIKGLAVVTLSTPAKSISELSEQINNDIANHQFGMGARKQVITALSEMELKDFQQFFRENISDKDTGLIIYSSPESIFNACDLAKCVFNKAPTLPMH